MRNYAHEQAEKVKRFVFYFVCLFVVRDLITQPVIFAYQLWLLSVRRNGSQPK